MKFVVGSGSLVVGHWPSRLSHRSQVECIRWKLRKSRSRKSMCPRADRPSKSMHVQRQNTIGYRHYGSKPPIRKLFLVNISEGTGKLIHCQLIKTKHEKTTWRMSSFQPATPPARDYRTIAVRYGLLSKRQRVSLVAVHSGKRLAKLAETFSEVKPASLVSMAAQRRALVAQDQSRCTNRRFK